MNIQQTFKILEIFKLIEIYQKILKKIILYIILNI